jgi:hypothetical protein
MSGGDCTRVLERGDLDSGTVCVGIRPSAKEGKGCIQMGFHSL